MTAGALTALALAAAGVKMSYDFGSPPNNANKDVPAAERHSSSGPRTTLTIVDTVALAATIHGSVAGLAGVLSEAGAGAADAPVETSRLPL